ncbi:conserved virulence factor C family protein [Paenibacillus thermotolerans]|uniref:conserved virulence factor C family protein n=1 Tax=Paenibacillus thermotolerans TaxID=3027807 RepID=UPI002367A9A2|nr:MULTISPECIES: conserved virulence factor C family protein [unclassified Paenibacillus]
MKILSIEPTPSPNAMKLNMNEKLAPGVKYSFSAGDAPAGRIMPDYLRRLLAIEGVKGVYQAADFISVERENGADWRSILAAVREAVGSSEGEAGGGAVSRGAAAEEHSNGSGFGEATVFVQYFRGIPMQVRVRAGDEESRVALPEKFAAAAVTAGSASPNLIMERRLVEHGVRYGELPEIAAQVAAELDAAFDGARLEELVKQAMAMEGDAASAEATVTKAPDEIVPVDELLAELDSPDWKKRYAVMDQLKPSPELLPVIKKALADVNFSVRRLAVVYLGDIKGPEAVELLCRALKDSSPPVRRTAGDALSDIGDPSAQPAMIDALRDPSKIVRWRAARFLYDCGDEAALDALRAASDDPEFEVALQARMAVERIASGEEAAGTVWQQMAARRRDG